MKPLVTIAIPFYNAQKYLGDSIESVLSQTYDNWKLLLIDDGSTDNSLAIAKSFASKDDRVRVYSDGNNKNLGFRLNQIPMLTETPFLARMDADDIMLPMRIEKQITTLLNNPKIDVLGTNAYSIDENANVIGIRMEYKNSADILPSKSFIHPTIMAKTSWFRANPYDTKAVRVEDAELWARTVHSNNFMSLNEPLLFYREYNGDYYKKYWRSLSGILYVWKKNGYTVRGLVQLITTVLKIGVYFIFERIVKSTFLITRRNHTVFKESKVINDFI